MLYRMDISWAQNNSQNGPVLNWLLSGIFYVLEIATWTWTFEEIGFPRKFFYIGTFHVIVNNVLSTHTYTFEGIAIVLLDIRYKMLCRTTHYFGKSTLREKNRIWLYISCAITWIIIAFFSAIIRYSLTENVSELWLIH